MVVPLEFVRNFRARRYILRLTRQGVARVTIPRHAEPDSRNENEVRPNNSRHEWRMVQDEQGARVVFADQSVPVSRIDTDFRPAIERHLWRMAAQEVPLRVMAFAADAKVSLRKIMIRNQRSRWGSCSRQGTISLNWRLIQLPLWVSDYLIWHELMHRRVMNHSRQFWQEVANVCPEYQAAERWIRQHRRLLL